MNKKKGMARLISILLTLALVVGIIGMLPPIQAKANTTITADAEFTVLKPITISDLTIGSKVYLVNDTSMNGRLATNIAAYVEVVDPNTYTGYSSTSDKTNHIDSTYRPDRYNSVPNNWRYVHVLAKHSSFDNCPNGFIYSSDGKTNWKYNCWYGGVTNQSLVMLKQVKVNAANNNAKITVETTPSGDEKLNFYGEESYAINKNDIAKITYEYDDENGNHIGPYEIPASNYNITDGEITFNDPGIDIAYGLNYMENQHILLPVSYLIKFDVHAGQKQGDESLYAQKLYKVESLVTQPADPVPNDSNKEFWHWSKENSQSATAWNFASDKVGEVMTLHAIYRNKQAITANNITMTYGDSANVNATDIGNQPMTYTVTNGTDVISVSNTGAISTKKSGTATVKIVAAENNNYAGAEKTITVTVNKRPVTLKGDNKTKTYGDSDAALTYTVDSNTPLVSGDNKENSFTGAMTRVAGETVGPYAIQKGTLTSDKYEISFVNGTYTINKKNISFVISDETKVYGTADPELTFDIASGSSYAKNTSIGINDSKASFTGSLYREQGEDVGEYAIKGDNIANSNYNITIPDAKLTITQRPVTVTADNQLKAYGVDDPELTYTTSPVGVADEGVYGDDQLDVEITRAEGEDAGDYEITVAEGPNGNPNYNVTYVNGTMTITTTEVTITGITAEDKVYDGKSDATVTAVVEGVNGETFTISNLKGEFLKENDQQVKEPTKDVAYDADGNIADIEVGLTGVIEEGTGKFANYTYNGIPLGADTAIPSTTAKITPKPITVVAYDNEKYYGEEDPKLLYGLDDESLLVEGEALANVVECNPEREEGEKYGEYNIAVNGTVLDKNYDVTFEDGTFTIHKFENVEVVEVEDTDGNDPEVAEVDNTYDELSEMLLTDEEKQMVEDGAGVKIYFVVDEGAPVSDEEKTQIIAVLPDGYTFGDNFDITLFKKFSNQPDPIQLHETPEKVKFTLKVPKRLLTYPADVTRTFAVVRMHDGVAEIIPSTFDPETETVSFETDRFSIYSIVYKDVKESKDNVAKKTEDEAPLMMVIINMIVSAFGMAYIIIIKKKLF